MKKYLVVMAVLSILFLANPVEGIFLGTTEGYIKNTLGNIVSGATVEVEVQSCANDCTGSYISDAGGYYVVANLNLPIGGTVRVDANKSTASGYNTGTADSHQAAYVNVTICDPPPAPNLTVQSDTHSQSVSLAWTSGGIDPLGHTVNYEYQLDSGTIDTSATSPQIETGLSFATHTWRVRACNTWCCSAWNSSSFDVWNNNPSDPVGDDKTVHTQDVSITWTSGTDTDPGDTTTDELEFPNGSIVDPATSGLTWYLGWGIYNMEVRTCDQYNYCGSDTFVLNLSNSAPSDPSGVSNTTHEDTIELNWTSGSDPDGDGTYDQLKFPNGTVINATSGIEVDLELGANDFEVRTCDDFGFCSVFQPFSVSFTNNPPSAPELTNQSQTEETKVQLQWTSGTDPDGDTVYDELVIEVYGNATTNHTPASSPFEYDSPGTALNIWKVRTCDYYGGCSSYAESYFITFTCPEVICPTTEGGFVFRSGARVVTAPAEIEEVVRTFLITIHPSVVPGKTFDIDVEWSTTEPQTGVSVGVDAPDGFDIKSQYLGDVGSGGSVQIEGVTDPNIAGGTYDLTLMLISDAGTLVRKTIQVTVLGPEDLAVCGNGICEFGESPESCPDDCRAVLFLDPEAIVKYIYESIVVGFKELFVPEALCGNGFCEYGETLEACPYDCDMPYIYEVAERATSVFVSFLYSIPLIMV